MRTAVEVAVVLALVAGYWAYWVFTPTQLQVSSIASSSSSPFALYVTLHNPTFKFLSGQLLYVSTEVDIPNPHNPNQTAVLGSIPRTYDFVLLPELSQTITVPMNSRVVTGADYDITVHIDGVGDQTITVTLRA